MIGLLRFRPTEEHTIDTGPSQELERLSRELVKRSTQNAMKAAEVLRLVEARRVARERNAT